MVAGFGGALHFVMGYGQRIEGEKVTEAIKDEI